MTIGNKRIIQLPLLILACATLGVLDALRSYLSAYYDGVFRLSFVTALRWDLIGWLLWVGFVPLVLALCARFQLTKRNWPRLVLLYIPLGILLSLVRTFLPALIDAALHGSTNAIVWLNDKFYVLVTDLLTAFVFYIAVLGFGQALVYYRRLREEELRSSRLEAQLSTAQLHALKMQLQPHFLFNALNSISALQLESAAEAQKMTARLGDFLRMTLENAGEHEVSLDREIGFIKCYLDIEKVRFGNRVTTDIRIAADARDCLVPNMILQPLVENAVQHGIAKKADAGKIQITAERENGWLKMRVSDNGKGVDAAKIDRIFSSGVGLSNTRARLEQSYGSEFLLQVENREGSGIEVTVCVPAR